MSDANYSSVVLNCQFDNVLGAEVFTDYSKYKQTATNTSAFISTAQSQLGNSSLRLQSSSYITFPSGTNFDVVTGNFTLELFFRPDAIGARQFVCGRANSGASALSILIELTATGVIKAWADATHSITGIITLLAATWYHIAFVNDSGTLRLFVGGTADGTASATGAADHSSVFGIGRAGDFSGLYTTGYVDGLRLTKGITRYTTGFTPPVRADFYAGNLAGNITESLAITDWRINAHRVDDGSLVNTTTSSGTTYSIGCDYLDACNLSIAPKIDFKWEANRVVALNEYCVPVDPDTTQRLFKATSIGSSPNQTGSSEPTWPTSGTVADGDITWTFIADLDDGMVQMLLAKIPS